MMRQYRKPMIVMLAVAQLLWLALPAGSEYQRTEARLNFVKGKVEVQRSGTANWARAVLQMRVYAGDKVSTDTGGETELVLDDGSIIKLKDKSLLEIERMEKQKKPMATITSLKAVNGRVLGCIKKLASKESKFNVSTPTAVAGIRGTVFAVVVDGDSTELDVLKGEVAIAGDKGKEVMVGEKMTTTVAKGDSARRPMMMTAAKIAFIMMWGGAAIKVGSMGAAAASAWFASTPAIIGGGAAVVAGTVAAIVISNKKPSNPPPGNPAPTIPATPPSFPSNQ